MVKFSSIKQQLDKLLNDEIFYSLLKSDEETKVKSFCSLNNIKIYDDLVNNNFLELRNSNFFDSEKEEETFKKLSGCMQVFYYLLFKKYSLIKI